MRLAILILSQTVKAMACGLAHHRTLPSVLLSLLFVQGCFSHSYVDRLQWLLTVCPVRTAWVGLWCSPNYSPSPASFKPVDISLRLVVLVRQYGSEHIPPPATAAREGERKNIMTKLTQQSQTIIPGPGSWPGA